MSSVVSEAALQRRRLLAATSGAECECVAALRPGTDIAAFDAAQAKAALAQDFLDSLDSAQAGNKPKVATDVEALFKALDQGPDTKYLRLRWDNQDDCWFQGLVSVDAKTGQMRMVGNYSEP